ncbi:pyridoxamine 5'-phosphate oxidase family protein [Phytoactinopolyspora mesophila]|uniref:Pyridoxamine 5'-phosphate oxidase family protein n=1 Tax=Phytoactinopolyspora mesophila TaxID=2650750 RepID=A0A7K3LWV0_9ACTN|nr:pyridoxamine 5'-phosphate oxidase family protein [Phytoactinopolyspora mesophila]NDL55499.1 pyridoxamine 5'-phosphate oxidase family protein [Phytoactinopolyspora mesophila]
MDNAPPLSPTARSTIRRGAKRARTDRATLYALLDSCLICHFATIRDGVPLVVPTGYGREGDKLYLHGSTGAASLMDAAGTAPISINVTRVDGVVYARSVFHHSMNYASAVIIGEAVPITASTDKLAALRVITEHIAPGSWNATRQPTRKELAKTGVLAISLHEASVKMRSGPPGDDEEDLSAHREWAGVLPLHQQWGAPQPCPLLPADTPVPDRVSKRPLPGEPAPSPSGTGHRLT